MADFIREQYAALPETRIFSTPTGNRTINKILMGTWAGVIEDNGDPDSRVKVITAGPDGWVDRGNLKDSMGLKIFFIDVGQGDGTLVEADGKRLLIDGGPNSNVQRYLRGYQYRYLLDNDKKIFLDTVLVSHFDADHYAGLTRIINDKDFEFGDVFHNGIARFSSSKNSRPDGYNTDLGRRSDGVLRTTFNDLDDARELLEKGGLQRTFKNFLEAVVRANDEGRLDSMRRLTIRDKTVPGYSPSLNFRIDVLGPIPRLARGRIDFPWFKDSSHTRNGHSLVLKLRFKDAEGSEKSFLLGGDLNTASENHLMNHFGKENPFEVDVAKSCHHGSSDFSVDFMKQVNPFATVISSGDNESYAHPRADALGCAGRYSRGVRPTVFSTELARSVNSGGDILFGMINCRTNGKDIVMAQMKERRTGADIWDSYNL